jgi:hypothetical protein
VARATALRQELRGLKLTALQRRAAAEGVAAARIEAAVDGDDPRAQLIVLLLEGAVINTAVAVRDGAGTAARTASPSSPGAAREEENELFATVLEM